MEFTPLIKKRAILTDEEIQAIESALKTEGGLEKLGQAMISPIRRTVDYQSVGRKFLVIDLLPVGALAYYDRDYPESEAYAIPAHGHVPIKLEDAERVTVSTYDIATDVRIRMAETKFRRYNVLDRAQERGAIDMAMKEDTDLFALVSACIAANEAQAMTSSSTAITRDDLSDALTLIEAHGLTVASMLMSQVTYAGMRKWGRNDIDPTTQRDLLKTGLMGAIWGVNIVTSKKVAAKTVKFFAEPDFVGVIPIRSDIDSLVDNEPKKLQLGFVVWENIGMSILNSWGVGQHVYTG